MCGLHHSSIQISLGLMNMESIHFRFSHTYSLLIASLAKKNILKIGRYHPQKDTHTHRDIHLRNYNYTNSFCPLQELFSGYFENIPTHYGLNMINQKITFPRDDNFSDDELSFLPYFVYFHTIKVRAYFVCITALVVLWLLTCIHVHIHTANEPSSSNPPAHILCKSKPREVMEVGKRQQEQCVDSHLRLCHGKD